MLMYICEICGETYSDTAIVGTFNGKVKTLCKECAKHSEDAITIDKANGRKLSK